MKVITPDSLVNESGRLSLVAVDIGQKGGFCGNETFADKLKLQHMPLNVAGIAQLVKWYEPDIVVAENVHTFGKQGLVSNGNLMEQKGVLKGVCAANEIKLVFVEPKEWISCYTLKGSKHFKSKTEWKKHLVEIATSMNFEIAPWAEKIDTWTADALLLWNYYASIISGRKLPKRGELQFKP